MTIKELINQLEQAADNVGYDKEVIISVKHGGYYKAMSAYHSPAYKELFPAKCYINCIEKED